MFSNKYIIKHKDKFSGNQYILHCDLYRYKNYRNKKIIIFYYETLRPEEVGDKLFYKLNVQKYPKLHIHKSRKITALAKSVCKKFIRRYYNNVEKPDQEVGQNLRSK